MGRCRTAPGGSALIAKIAEKPRPPLASFDKVAEPSKHSTVQVASQSSQTKGPVFAVFVSEKGGDERREVFEGTELTLGRVQGNDLVLPKGNVSKRHARLLFRDGRFIVTDLNSTNGTYVNRRRISHATIVREGDRIYIGDFVLRLELTDDAERTSARQASGVPIGSPPSSMSEGSGPLVSGRPSATGSDPNLPRLPLAPRVPTIGKTRAESKNEAPESRSSSGDSPGPLPRPVVDDVPTPEIQRQRHFLANIEERVLALIDEAELERDITEATRSRVLETIDRVLSAQREGDDGQPSGLPADQAEALIAAELLDLGPLGPLLADPLVTRIVVSRFNRIHVERELRYGLLPLPFTSESALNRVTRRLCRAANYAMAQGATMHQLNIKDGTRLTILTGSLAPQGTVVLLRRSKSIHRDIEDLVRHGVVSRAMANFLHQCLQGRVNVLLVGSDEEGLASLLNGLCSICDDPALYVVGQGEVFGLPEDRVVPFSPAEEPQEFMDLLRALGGGGGRVVIGLGEPSAARSLTSTAGFGLDGVIAAVKARNLRRALLELTALLLAQNPGMSVSAAREWVRATFDIALEVSRLGDGRYRVLRLAELMPSPEEIRIQDIFTFAVERTLPGGAVEGSFAAQGTAPRIASELSARGIEVDQSLFSRPPSR